MIPPGQYEYVFVTTQEVCGGFTVTDDGRIMNVTGILVDDFKEGVLVADEFRLNLLNNGYFRLTWVSEVSEGVTDVTEISK